MFVRFWGTRGSIPTPGPSTARYGGNTSCVELRSDDGNLFVFDCGTGIRELGMSLLGETATPPRIHILIGHTHWDHIQGFPFFTPVFLPGTEINIYAPLGFQRSLEDAMSGQMQYSYFPVKLQDLASRIHYTELDEGFFRIGDCLVETQYLNHTAPTIAYKITEGATSVAYVTDHEPFWKSSGPDFEHPGDQRHIEFIRDLDLLIHDAQYSEEEYETKVGWGHSPLGYVRDVALAAEVHRLALFHHDPTHDDAWIDAVQDDFRRVVRERGSTMDVFAAAEGLKVEIQGKVERPPVVGDSALRQRSIIGQRVLLISPNKSDFSLMEPMLVEDGLILMPMQDAELALKRAQDFSPSLAIVDAALVEETGAFLEALRERSGRAGLPVVLLTDKPDLAEGYDLSDSSTDYLERPFSPPMLRSRVRAWLARTGTADQATAQSAPSSRTIEKEEPAPANYADTLAQTALFKDLDAAQLQNLVENASEQIFPQGHPILREGERGTNVFIIIAGRVRIMESVPEGPSDMFLGELGPGEVFGEIGFLRDTPRSATVVTLERTRCLVFPQADFLDTLESSSQLSIAMLRVLAGRLADADRLLARYAPDPLTGLPGRRAFHDIYHRLAAGAQRRGNGAILLLIDIENLRAVNNEFGYSAGDDVLKAMSEALIAASRTTDLLARCGGDEFAILLIDSDVSDCEQISRRVTEHLTMLVQQRSLPTSIHFDVGIAVSDKAPENVDGMLRQADDDIQKKKKKKSRDQERSLH